MPRKVVSGPDYDDEYGDDYDEYDDDYDDYGETGHGDTQLPMKEEKESLKKSSGAVPVLWRCSMCMFDNHESMVYCEMCGVFRESFIKSSKDGSIKVNRIPSDSGKPLMPKSDSTKVPLKTRTADFGGDTEIKNAGISHEKVSSTQSASVGSSSGTGKKVKHIALPEDVPVERTTQLISDHFQLKEEQSSRAGSSAENEDAAQKLSSDIHKLGLEKNEVDVAKTCLPEEYKPEKWMFADEESGVPSQLNLAIVGHVDSGKSTLSGRLLHLLGKISKKDMHKNEKEAKEKGKASFAYAWAMDESSEERERGVTMTVAVAYLETKKYRVVLLDSPGHKDFVPNMISGATQADAAILVVDACSGSFEAGMDGEGGKSVGQTKEHAQLIRSFGVEQLIVAVNKMDAVGYSKERFEFIKVQLGSFLRSCNFKDSSVIWIPLSAVENQNLINIPSDGHLTSWYQGFCLLEAIDSLQLPSRDVSKPLILPICDVIKSQSTGQLAAFGKLETGAIRNGSKVLVSPCGEVATVKTIERDSNSCDIARAGDNVAVSLLGIEGSKLVPGGVLCNPGFPVLVSNFLELRVLVLDVTIPILVGYQVEFHIHHVKEAARVTKIVALLDKAGKPSKTAPRFLKSKQNAVVQVTLESPVCVQEFSKCRALGRAFLRSSGSTIAVGVVMRVLGQDKS
ncbi:HBS1-like protein isoform X2 [Oryza brachyantha]|uniref:Tr-type G domain-containing protein n=1 Tax=Oryza brachyantha TaxID=4533 RepID=J3M0Z1_ORYBR|nr:HBS1-like protein isoform X2 [Oryza brachyantha]